MSKTWVEWRGGDNPEPKKTVLVAMRSLLPNGTPAIMRKRYCSDDIHGWKHKGNAGDIVAYCVVG